MEITGFNFGEKRWPYPLKIEQPLKLVLW